MLSDFLRDHITSQAKYVTYGYGQVEPNHLSAQRNAQIYAQLPANADIKVLEQGQFVKYDYGCKSGPEVNFVGPGEWMLVYNEIKLYRDHQDDCEFAMVKDNYNARVYSPFGTGLDKANAPTADGDITWDRQARFFNGENENTSGASGTLLDGNPEDVTAAPDMYELHYNEDPFHFAGPYKEAMMKEGTKMVPRVFKTMPGDIFTTNTINSASVELGDLLLVGDNGILAKQEDVTNAEGPIVAAPNDNPQENKYATAAAGDMRWQVVKVYTMPDHQKGVKVMRVI